MQKNCRTEVQYSIGTPTLGPDLHGSKTNTDSEKTIDLEFQLFRHIKDKGNFRRFPVLDLI